MTALMQSLTTPVVWFSTELLGYKDTVTISTQTELSVLYLLYNVTHCFVTKGNSIMIEVLLNVAKSLFFRNVFREKLIGKRKPYWCTCLFWEIYIFHTILKVLPLFPLDGQILKDKTIWRKSAWQYLGKRLSKNAGSSVLLSGRGALALGLAIPLRKNWKRGYGPRRKVFLRKPPWDRNLLKVRLGSDTGNNLHPYFCHFVKKQFSIDYAKDLISFKVSPYRW